MKRLYDKKARGLVLLSDVINDYPELKIFLTDHKAAIETDLVGCSTEVNNIFSNKTFADIELQARSEWKRKSENPEVVLDYQIKYVFTIENQKNQAVLNVGSSCVVDLNIKTEKEMLDFEKNAKKLFRLNQLSMHIPHIRDKVDNISLLREESLIIVPESVSVKYVESGKAIRALYDRFLDIKTPEKDCLNVLMELQKALQKHIGHEDEIRIYISENENSMLVAKKAYIL